MSSRMAHTDIPFILRSSTTMNTALSEQLVRTLVRERQQQAAALNRAARLRSARRWQQRAESTARRARLARLAVR
jgi:hypothetical protein